MDLITRADATPDVGAGHVMRCAALAEAWRTLRLGQVAVWGAVSLSFAQARLGGIRASVSGEPPDLAGAVLVVDTYDAGERIALAGLEDPALRVLVDDLGGAVPLGFDAVWNPNAYGSRALYPGFTGAVVAGIDAIAVRSGLPTWTGAGLASVGVMLGGGRVSPRLRGAVDALARKAGRRAFAGVGDWVPRAWIQADTSDPWPAMGACGCLITAGGSTVWEAAAVGIPSVVVKTAANQALVEAWVAACGVPTVDAVGTTTRHELEDQLRAALEHAAPLPPLSSGAEMVARRLAELAGRCL